jgi:hypothetical protein
MTRHDTEESWLDRELMGLPTPERNARQEAIRADVSKRLRKACSHLSDEAFAKLVDKIVGVQLKAERGPRKMPS